MQFAEMITCYCGSFLGLKRVTQDSFVSGCCLEWCFCQCHVPKPFSFQRSIDFPGRCEGCHSLAAQVDMIAFLPHYLEGLFGILASDNRDFRLKALGNRDPRWAEGIF